MQVERRIDFNQQSELTTAVDVNFDWKLGSGHEVDVNTFYPEILMSLNLKRPTFYEVLGNSMIELLKEEDIMHATKVQPEGMPAENVLTEGTAELSQLLAHSTKY